ncbi:hypothetical protein CAAN1_08S04236 [[Candida] anglica]|uniref:Hpc2-related domain-containing protein n=1 Tax=[Candida] anglica TaxID=148631 RepID=A0ABP0EA27_9ASCO
MSGRNFTISSLLDSNDDNTRRAAGGNSSSAAPPPVAATSHLQPPPPTEVKSRSTSPLAPSKKETIPLTMNAAQMAPSAVSQYQLAPMTSHGSAAISPGRTTPQQQQLSFQTDNTASQRQIMSQPPKPILVDDRTEVIVVEDEEMPGLGPPNRRAAPKKRAGNNNTTSTSTGSISLSGSVVPTPPGGPVGMLPKLIPKPLSQGSSSPTPSVSSFQARPTNSTGPSNATGATGDAIWSFQSSFQLNGGNGAASSPTPATPTPNKASINSIINVEDAPDRSPSVEVAAPKKKRAPRRKKEDGEAPATKKRKPAATAANTATAGAGLETVIEVTANATPPPGEEQKKARAKPKPRKKTPDTAATTNAVTSSTTSAGSSTSKTVTTVPEITPAPEIQPTSTAERNSKAGSSVPNPTVVEIGKKESSPNSAVATTGTTSNAVSSTTATTAPVVPASAPPPVEAPIIALNIPLLDPKNPKPGQAQVVVNVLKLAEEKYGWAVMHPNAKSAIDLMDDIMDDDEDAADEDDDEEKAAPTLNEEVSKKDTPELTEEQLVRQHEVKMNRKVGKYDYEDPFIDDVELQWEEEITSTKDGFFVYWGPLVEDRNAPTAKKAGGKAKK